MTIISKVRIMNRKYKLVFNSYLYDLRLHLKYSLYYKKESKYGKDSLRCSIMLLNHQLEKALTYQTPTIGYGKEKLRILLNQIDRYMASYGVDDIIITSYGVLKSHFDNIYSWKNDELYNKYQKIFSKINTYNNDFLGGTVMYDPMNIGCVKNLESFLFSRRSCRIFSKERILMTELKDAVRLAMTAPSACNRQSTRVHVYENKDIIKRIIIAQKSDIEWCLEADKLLIITSNKYYYRDVFERNQGMFDSGLFSMVLNLSLHNKGIGSCFKMAQKTPSIDKNTKRIAEISENEDIDVLYLIGKYPEQPIAVAKSARISIENVLTIHEISDKS